MDWVTRRELKIFLTVFLVLGLFVQWYGVNANSRFDLTRAIVDHGKLDINELHRNAGDRSFYRGDYYSDKEPGMAFLAVPIYATWKGVYGMVGNATVNTGNRAEILTANNVIITYPRSPGTYYLSALILAILFTSTLALSILTVLIYRISGDFLEDRRKRLLVTFGFAFGTLLTHYGTMFMPNAVVTLLSFSSFYLLYRTEERPSWRRMVGSGALGGFAVVVDPTAAPVLVGTFIYAGLTFRKIPYLYVLGGFIGGLPMMIYNTVLFGYPWMLPRFFLDPALYPQLQQASSAIPRLTEQGFRLQPVKLFYVAVRLLFLPYRGIFYWFPFLFVAVLGAYQFTRDNTRIALTLGVSGVLLLTMIAGWWAWWMGGFFGARYLAVLVPFLMFPLFYGSRFLDNRLLAAVIALSVLVNLAGYQGLYEDELKDLQRSSEMKPEYRDDVRSFRPLGNPVMDHYLPGLMEKGPQSRILNGLSNGEIPPDIRAYAETGERAHPLLLGWVIVLIVAGVWRDELMQMLEKHRDTVLSAEDGGRGEIS